MPGGALRRGSKKNLEFKAILEYRGPRLKYIKYSRLIRNTVYWARSLTLVEQKQVAELSVLHATFMWPSEFFEKVLPCSSG